MSIDPFSFMAGGLVALVVVVTLIMIGTLLRPWVRSRLAGCPVPLVHVVGMRIRGNPARLLIDGYIALRKDGFDVSIDEIEYAYMGNQARISTVAELVERFRENRET